MTETDSYSKYDENNCDIESKILVGRASRLVAGMIHENAELFMQQH
jgi:hypothetical protein